MPDSYLVHGHNASDANMPDTRSYRLYDDSGRGKDNDRARMHVLSYIAHDVGHVAALVLKVGEKKERKQS